MYDANGGYWEGHTETTWTDTFTKGEEYITEPNWYKRDGYKFTGWNTNKDKKPNDMEESDTKGYWWAHYSKDWGTDNTVTKSGINYWKGVASYLPKTLYAIWSPGVTYQTNYPAEAKNSLRVSDKTSTTYPEYGSEYQTEPIGNWQIDGYTFLGWNTSKNATIDTTTGWGWCTSHITQTGGSVGYWKGTFEESKPATLYAIWSKDYKVTYDANGGADSKDAGVTQYTNKATYGKNYVTLSNSYSDGTDWFVREGYTFDGWNEKADGSGTDWTEYIGKPWEYTYKRDTTLYAKWDANEYTVKYDANGGTGNMPDDTAEFDKDFITSECAFVRPGYVFDGWIESGNKTDGTRWSLTSEGVYESGKSWKWSYDYGITLKAVWKAVAVSYTVEHYTQKLGGNADIKDTTNYSLYMTVSGSAVTGSVITPGVKTIAGFTAPSAQEVTVKGDGSTVVKYYYTRNRYKLVMDSGTGIESVSCKSLLDTTLTTGVKTEREYYYGDTVTVSAVIESGYTWSNWIALSGYEDVTVNKSGSTNNPGTFKMPDHNVGLEASTTAGTTKYTVKHWILKVNGNPDKKNQTNYSLYKTNSYNAVTGTKVTPAVLNITGFSAPSVQSVIVNGDGSSVVNYYYTRNSYTVYVKKEYGIDDVYIERIKAGQTSYSAPEKITDDNGISVQYGERFRVSAGVNERYNWNRWSGTYESTDNPFEVRSMPANDVTLTASAAPRSVKVILHRNTKSTDTITKEVSFTVSSMTEDGTSKLPDTDWLNDKPGYTLKGWSEVSSATTADYGVNAVLSNSWIAQKETRHLYGVWSANTDTAYKVNHWFENIGADSTDHTDYTLKKTESFKGTTDAAVTPSLLPENEYTGFTPPVVQTVIIKGDGSSVVDYYYTRNSYKVTYNAKVNGGVITDERLNTQSSDTTYKADTTNKADITSNANNELELYFEYGESIDLSVKAEKSGTEHAGWNTNKNATTGLTSYTMPANDVRLYAIFRKDITVTYVYWNETKKETKVVYNNTNSAEFTLPALEKEKTVIEGAVNTATNSNNRQSILYKINDVKPLGYTLTDSVSLLTDMESAAYTAGETVEVTNSMTLYVQYSANAKAEFDLVGGTENDSTKNTVCSLAFLSADKDTVKSEGINLPTCQKEPFINDEQGTMTSYVLKGWKLKENAGGELLLAGTYFNLKRNTEFVAVWEEAVENLTYTIHFDGNGGPAVSDVPQDILARFGETYTLSNTIKKTGCYIVSWNTRADGTGQSFTPTAQVTNLASRGGEVVTLYAQWKFVGFRIVGVGSTMHGQMFIKEPDDTICDEYREIYERIKNKTIWDYVNLTPEQCVKQWKMDKDGNITKLK